MSELAEEACRILREAVIIVESERDLERAIRVDLLNDNMLGRLYSYGFNWLPVWLYDHDFSPPKELPRMPGYKLTCECTLHLRPASGVLERENPNYTESVMLCRHYTPEYHPPLGRRDNDLEYARARLAYYLKRWVASFEPRYTESSAPLSEKEQTLEASKLSVTSKGDDSPQEPVMQELVQEVKSLREDLARRPTEAEIDIRSQLRGRQFQLYTYLADNDHFVSFDTLRTYVWKNEVSDKAIEKVKQGLNASLAKLGSHRSVVFDNKRARLV